MNSPVVQAYIDAVNAVVKIKPTELSGDDIARVMSVDSGLQDWINQVEDEAFISPEDAPGGDEERLAANPTHDPRFDDDWSPEDSHRRHEEMMQWRRDAGID